MPGAGLGSRALSLFSAELRGPRRAAELSRSRWLLRGEPVSSRPGGRRAAVALLWPWGAPGEASKEDSGGLGDAAREPWLGAAPEQAAPPAEGRLRGREAARARAPRGSALGAGRGRAAMGGRGSAVRAVGARGRIAAEQGASFPVAQGIYRGAEGAGRGGEGLFVRTGGQAARSLLPGGAERGLAGQQRPGRGEPPGSPPPPRGARPSFAAPPGLQGFFLSLSAPSSPLSAGRSGPSV